MNKRQAKFEYLRIIAMCMIIAMHYMTKGMCLPKLSADASVSNHIWWLIYGFCMVAPNAYVLISGYFLIDKWDGDWTAKEYIGKALKLVAEVLFYSWLVAAIFALAGGELDFGTRLTILLPIEEEHYWFAASYILLYLISPLLSKGIRSLTKEQHRGIIILMLVVFSGFKSINPYLVPIDKYGCDLGWFICLFVIAAYIKMYGIQSLDRMTKSVGWYIALVLSYMAECSAVALIVRRTGKLEYFMDMVYSYNHILVLMASVSFFCIFMNMKEQQGKCSQFVARLGAYTFGVYLLHENLAVRHLWFKWLGIEKVPTGIVQFFHMLGCIVVVFVVGVIVDAVRTAIFNLVIKKKS